MSASERRLQRRFRRAYAAAWAARQRTGDDSDQLLVDALTRYDVALGAAYGFFLESWRRGTPPHAMPVEALKEGIVLARPLTDAFLEIAEDIEGARRIQLHELPAGRARLSRQPHWAMQRLPVVFDKAAIALLGSADLPVANTRTGERAAQVWLLPAEAPTADVLMGEVRLGSVRLSATTWRLLREAETDNTFADGLVYCWPIGPGMVEAEALLVTLPE